MNNQITNSTNTKFLGLSIEETLPWNCHINQILGMLCNQGYYTSHVGGHFKNDLSFICAFDNDIWYNYLENLNARY